MRHSGLPPNPVIPWLKPLPGETHGELVKRRAAEESKRCP